MSVTSPQLSRRHMLLSAAGLGLSQAIALPAFATDKADWRIGWQNTRSDVLRTPDMRMVSGALPKGLRGTLYRNGPAVFSRGGATVDHWFDGDGMVQAFNISGGKASHVGRLVATEKLATESKLDRISVFGFGTVPENPTPMSGPDSANAANTSVLPVNGELLSLWEGGSAYRMDMDTLETRGIKVWRDDLKGMPFSAHPKVELDGTIWNFGQAASANVLVVYKISAGGELQSFDMVKDVPGGMIHDFCMTQRHLIFVCPSLRAKKTGKFDGSYLSRFVWDKDAPQRVVVLDKSDLSVRRDYELPPGFQFHFGNAYENKSGEIRFSMCTGGVEFAQRNARALVKGILSKPAPSTLTEVTLHADGTASEQKLLGGIEDCEFPQFSARRSGLQAQYLYMVGGSTASRPGHSQVIKYDMTSGRADRFDYGPYALVEEHLFVPRAGASREDDGWLIGTVLDYQTQQTQLNVFDARRISDGPIAVLALDYALPLGFHGAWAGAST